MWKGMPPSSLQGSVHTALSLLLLPVPFSYPEQQRGWAEPPAHAIPPAGGIPFPCQTLTQPACLCIQPSPLCFSSSPPEPSLALARGLPGFPQGAVGAVGLPASAHGLSTHSWALCVTDRPL